MYKAIIFDLDGTLIDSESVWFEVFKELCAEYGKEYTAQLHSQQLGRASAVVAKQICEALQLPLTVEEFVAKEKVIEERRFADALPEMQGAIACVKRLQTSGYALGLATASGPEYRERMLRGLGIYDCFSAFVSGKEVAYPKPAPDIYLRAAELVGFSPADCLAVEDGNAGVASALSAGMHVLGVVDKRYNDDLPNATKVIASLDEFDAELIVEMTTYGR